MTRMLSLVAGMGVLFAAAPPCRAAEVIPEVHPQPIVVRVLDGRSGTPQEGRHVLLTGGYDQRDLRLSQWQQEARTDHGGLVRLSNDLRNLPWLRVEVLKARGCEPDARRTDYSVEQIRAAGQVGANRCGAVVALEEPGVLTVFVRGSKAPAAEGTRLVAPVAAPVVPLPAVEARAAATVRVHKVEPEPASEGTRAPVPAAEERTTPKATLPEPRSPSIPPFLAFPVDDALADTPMSMAGPAPAPPVAPTAPRQRPRTRSRPSGPRADPKIPAAPLPKSDASKKTDAGSPSPSAEPVRKEVVVPKDSGPQKGKPPAAGPPKLPAAAAPPTQHVSAPRRAHTTRYFEHTSGREALRVPSAPLNRAPDADLPKAKDDAEMPVFRLRVRPVAPSVAAEPPSDAVVDEGWLDTLCQPNPH